LVLLRSKGTYPETLKWLTFLGKGTSFQKKRKALGERGRTGRLGGKGDSPEGGNSISKVIKKGDLSTIMPSSSGTIQRNTQRKEEHSGGRRGKDQKN